MFEIKQLLKAAAEKGASDLHVIEGLAPITRIDGVLAPLDSVKTVVTGEDLEKMVNALTTKEQKSLFLSSRDLDLGFGVDDFRFRINLSYEKGNYRIAARVIPNHMPTIEEVGMPEVIYKLLSLRQGLILVTGPTSSGKSTTLAAMVNYLNSNYNYNIITFEDPIEFVFSPDKSLVSQRQLGSDFLSFDAGLKHVLRQDPNVIMVGEMRDLETISAAITLAETGHLVLATLHTYSAAQTIDRIIDTFPSHQQNQVKSQLSMILSAVISQRLFPKVGGGRVAAREIMIRTAAVANLIREHKIAQVRSVIETGYKEGMQTLERSIKDLVSSGALSEEVAKVALDDPGLAG